MIFLLWEGVKRQMLGVFKISSRRLAGNNEVMFTNWVRNFFFVKLHGGEEGTQWQ
jgi:hypothetical protein